MTLFAKADPHFYAYSKCCSCLQLTDGEVRSKANLNAYQANAVMARILCEKPRGLPPKTPEGEVEITEGERQWKHQVTHQLSGVVRVFQTLKLAHKQHKNLPYQLQCHTLNTFHSRHLQVCFQRSISACDSIISACDSITIFMGSQACCVGL